MSLYDEDGIDGPWERRMTKGTKNAATKLELTVLRDVLDGRDPWRGRLGGSRLVSQALARCKRKGLVAVEQNAESETIYVVTPAGGAALFPRGVERFSVGTDDEGEMCARCGSSITWHHEDTLDEGEIRWPVCLSVGPWCEEHPRHGRKSVRGAGQAVQAPREGGT